MARRAIGGRTKTRRPVRRRGIVDACLANGPGSHMDSAGASASVHRFWRRFRRRSALVQIAIVVVALVVIVGVVYAVQSRPDSSPGSAVGTAPSAGGPTSVTTASTSSRGVTKSSINLVFPVVSLNSLAGQGGFAE